MKNKYWVVALLVGAVGGWLIASFFEPNESEIYAMSPLTMQVLVDDCNALHGRPIPKYPSGSPMAVYRVDCMQ